MKICPSYYIKPLSQYAHTHEKCDQLEQAICGTCGTFLCICGLKHYIVVEKSKSKSPMWSENFKIWNQTFKIEIMLFVN
jgi:hypothetical protein